MLTYTLKKTPGHPLYEQLYQNIRDDIAAGRLPAGRARRTRHRLGQAVDRRRGGRGDSVLRLGRLRAEGRG